jgi:hypothetical protein
VIESAIRHVDVDVDEDDLPVDVDVGSAQKFLDELMIEDVGCSQNEVLLPDDVYKAQCLDVDVGVGIDVSVDVDVELIRLIPAAGHGRPARSQRPLQLQRPANPFHSELTMAPSQLLVAILDIDTNDF